MKSFSLIFSTAMLVAFASACGDTEPNDGTDAGTDATTDGTVDDGAIDDGSTELEPTCVTEISAADGESVFAELCAVEGGVRHVRIEGAYAPPHHASYQIFLGLDEPIGNQADLGEGQFKVQFYGGGTPAPPAMVDAYIHEASVGFVPGIDASFVNAPSTVCFDIHDGSASTPPYLILWIDGVNDADCDDAATLTMDSAAARELEWLGAIDKEKKSFFYQASGIDASPVITLSNEPVLTEAEILAWAPPSAGCVTEDFEATNLYQPFCSPDEGPARHFRIENAGMAVNNRYFYFVIGDSVEDHGSSTSAPGAPGEGDGRLLITAGKSSSSAVSTLTYFQFNGGNSGQYFNDEGAGWYDVDSDVSQLWFSDFEGPSTVCFDLKPEGDHTRFVLWAQGLEGADCFDFDTLTLQSAIYDSAEDDVAFWEDASISDSGNNFFKASGSSDFATVERITTFPTPVLP